MNRPPPLAPVLLALVFLGPLAAAVLTYYGPWGHTWLPRLPGEGRELLDPPLPLPPAVLSAAAGGSNAQASFQYRWSLIYARIAPCEERCVRHLTRLYQVHLALGKDGQRLQRVYLYAGEEPRVALKPGLIFGRLDDARGAAILELLGEERIRSGRLYVVDPLGNLVASYPADAEQRVLLEDLQRLLRLSRIG